MKIFPIFIPFAGCQHRCIYCQQNLITRTIEPDFNKIREQLSHFCFKYKDSPKEIAFYGGSFTLLPFQKQKAYLQEIASFIPHLEGIRVSTRPDGITDQILDFASQNHIVTIELGIQSFNDHVLKETERPYSSRTAYEAALAIKKAGFKLSLQLMPGLPGDTTDTINQTVEKTISISPEFVRIYPTLVLRDTVLADRYRAGLYSPLSLEEAVIISADMTIKFRNAGIKVIKTGLHSDLSSNPTEDLVKDYQASVMAGPYHPSFGELVSREILFRNIVSCYDQGKTYLISSRALSLLKRDSNYLIKKIKKTLPIINLPIIIEDGIEKEEVRLVDRKPRFLW